MQELKERVNTIFFRVSQDRDLLLKVRRNLIARLQCCLHNQCHMEAGEQARMLRAIGLNGSVLWVRRHNREIE